MMLLTAIVNIVAIAFLLHRISVHVPTLLRTWYWLGAAIHLIGGIFVGALYHYYYGEGDTLHYFADGKILAALARDDFSSYLKFLWSNEAFDQVQSITYLHEPRALLLSKIVSVINLITYDNYWITSLYFSLGSFLGVFTLVRSLIHCYPEHTPSIFFSFLLLPSSVLWSCGIIKESLAMAGLNYLVAAFVLIYNRISLRWFEWLLILVSSLLLYNIKYYYAAVLFPILATTLFHQRVLQLLFHPKSFGLLLLTWSIPLLLTSALVTFLHPNFHPERFLSVIYSNYTHFITYSNPEDAILFPSLNQHWYGVVANAPWALVSGLFRPFLWEAGTLFQLAAALENALLLVLTISVFPIWGKLRIGEEQWLLIISTIAYCLLLCIFLTLSTPNFGTLIRYRVGFISFFTFLITINNPLFNFFVKSLQSLVKQLVAKKA